MIGLLIIWRKVADFLVSSMVLGLTGSTADLPTIVSDRIARAFNRFRATLAVALDMCKAYDRVCHAGLLHRLKPYFVLFLSNRWLGDVLDGKSLQEYPVNAGVIQGSILGSTLLLIYNNDLSDGVICNIASYAHDTTLCCKCDQASDLWQQLELASELESDLQDIVDWGRKWLSVDFSAGKTQLFSFDLSNNYCCEIVCWGFKIFWVFFKIFKILGLFFCSKLDWDSYIISIAKIASKKLKL